MNKIGIIFAMYEELEEMLKLVKLNKINKIYEEIIPYYIVPMLNSLYQYSIPLILQFLIDDSNRNNRINLTIGRWAREISMVNGNYANIRRNKKEYLQTCCERLES